MQLHTVSTPDGSHSDVGSGGGGMSGSKNTVSLGFFGKIRKLKQ